MNNEIPRAKHSVVFLDINASEASGRGPSLSPALRQMPPTLGFQPPRDLPSGSAMQMRCKLSQDSQRDTKDPRDFVAYRGLPALAPPPPTTSPAHKSAPSAVNGS